MVRPLGDNLFVRLEEESEVTKGGIVIPEVATNTAHGIAEVVAVGPGRWNKANTRRIPVSVKEGERVVIVKYLREVHTNLATMKALDDDIFRIKEDDIICVVEDDNTKPEDIE